MLSDGKSLCFLGIIEIFCVMILLVGVFLILVVLRCIIFGLLCNMLEIECMSVVFFVLFVFMMVMVLVLLILIFILKSVWKLL